MKLKTLPKSFYRRTPQQKFLDYLYNLILDEREMRIELPFVIQSEKKEEADETQNIT